ncbi:MAG: MFS transporter [Tepidisphaeraceae bacterium]|jgi:MFS family permease
MPTPKNSVSPLGHIFRALRHRNYRLFFGGQLISVIGTFLTNTAMIWLAFVLTTDPQRKAWLIGVVAFSSQIPVFLLGPIGGVWVDRLNRQKLLLVTQTLSMLQSFALAYLSLTHLINIPEVIGLALVQGIINAIDIPGRQAFLVEMITDRQDLANGIALNSTLVHSARLIGPAMAGLLIAWVGIGWCFLLDGISYLAVLAALAAMRIAPRPPRRPSSVAAELREGFRYITAFKPARVLLMLMAIVSISGVPAMRVLMPIFGSHFGGSLHGAQVFGFLSGAIAIGALIGAIRLAGRKTVVGLGRLIGISTLTYTLAIALFAVSPYLWLSLVIAAVAGWGMITSFASTNTILQTLVDDDKRGRVMSFFSMSFMGMTPFGMLMSGALASHLARGTDPVNGASRTILIASAVCLAASLRYWMLLPQLRKIVRPIYAQRGIIDQIAQGLQVTDAPAPAEN